MYRLKPNQESFEVVDGPLAGKKFEKGLQYDRIPEQDAGRFETVKPEAVTTLIKPTDPEPVVVDTPEHSPDPYKFAKKGVKDNA